MKAIFATLSTLALLAWANVRLVADIQFDRNCEGHMKRAADANTVALAMKEMEVVLDYLESKNFTSGYTSILYRTPDEDVAFWYQNLKSALGELQAIDSESATQLEKSNILMKLRETLLDSGEKGVNITAPSGISIYPNNGLYCFWGSISFILMLAAFAAIGLLDN